MGVLSVEAPDRAPVATLVNWTLHPETLADGNPLVSADFVGPLRASVEERLGGVAIYASAAAGGFVGLPALRDAMPGEARMVVGLANNELGYILPPEDFVEPDHPNYYEESVSPGPEASRIIVDAMRALVESEAK